MCFLLGRSKSLQSPSGFEPNSPAQPEKISSLALLWTSDCSDRSAPPLRTNNEFPHRTWRPEGTRRGPEGDRKGTGRGPEGHRNWDGKGTGSGPEGDRKAGRGPEGDRKGTGRGPEGDRKGTDRNWDRKRTGSGPERDQKGPGIGTGRGPELGPEEDRKADRKGTGRGPEEDRNWDRKRTGSGPEGDQKGPGIGTGRGPELGPEEDRKADRKGTGRGPDMQRTGNKFLIRYPSRLSHQKFCQKEKVADDHVLNAFEKALLIKWNTKICQANGMSQVTAEGCYYPTCTTASC